ncbi:MAG: S4 domain-containing protein YaaA [Erysipelotrichaceae bacterium]|nr:S4 domain-containing protein YaaA [Erysipelotrichaceae bacterium]
MNKSATKIEIHTEYLELQQLLKIIGLISTGGEAKVFLASQEVTVDGIAENRRGRKLYPGQVVVVEGKNYQIAKACS